MSDTHSENNNIKFEIPKGDILIVAGDFTRTGAPSEVNRFNEWMKSLPHQHKIVICGNHELSFDQTCQYIKGYYRSDIKNVLCDCIYLEDSAVTIYGIKFYGSPWQPEFGGWAFNVPRGEKCLSKWNLIPDDTDVLITHGPPLGYGDKITSKGNIGCVELLSTIQKRVKPKYHVFGHIHEGYGLYTDGTTLFINASTCNRFFVPENLPIVFDYSLPSGQTKENYM
ncbi:Metallophosphoesterase domain-containing protein 1-like Protein [Tribolium castaneum]|uniref:Metallophosphoesterase domain-containing protein 1-like Protein n=2 Tax=Tribolium castaneum TaxID=7070 RepID=A0A139WKX5_TRICA|nr:PREDICTED: metallophosphoesterase domain-containing protein 1-like [Tribolium castaneum]KYB28543.1 Metallophosphoesterase domain-containing protein 1-like Protein [Tribolium castaneum]|eukprot:XP_015833673.1 PREDICTED: metallophosphoesterase domain-containing protein 1-like [Tribolium castaneum]